MLLAIILSALAMTAIVAARYALDQPERMRLVRSLAARTEGNALFLGELYPLGDALQVLYPVLQAQFLLLRQSDDGVAHPAL